MPSNQARSNRTFWNCASQSPRHRCVPSSLTCKTRWRCERKLSLDSRRLRYLRGCGNNDSIFRLLRTARGQAATERTLLRSEVVRGASTHPFKTSLYEYFQQVRIEWTLVDTRTTPIDCACRGVVVCASLSGCGPSDIGRKLDRTQSFAELRTT